MEGEEKGYLFIHLDLVKLEKQEKYSTTKQTRYLHILIIVTSFHSGREESPGGVNIPTSENFFLYYCWLDADSQPGDVLGVKGDANGFSHPWARQ